MMQSEHLNELAGALAKAQSKMPKASFDGVNPHFKSKYSKLVELVTSSRPFLSKNGLSVVQRFISTEDRHGLLETILMHSSGQWIASRIKMFPSSDKIQEIGSHMTYLRRYAYASIVGIVSDDDTEDDDGEMAMGRTKNKKAESHKETSSYERVNADQLRILNNELRDYPNLVEKMFATYNISSLAELPASKFEVVFKRAQEIKATGKV